MLFRTSRLGPIRFLTADVAALPPPRGLNAEREAGLVHARMVLLLARAPNVGAKWSFPLAVLPPP
jgi:hypothetical protein